MKKKAIASILTTAMVFSMLTGCGSGESSPAATDAGDAAATETAQAEDTEQKDTEEPAQPIVNTETGEVIQPLE